MSICMTAPNYLQKLLSGMEVTAKKEHSRTSNENQTHNHGTVLFRVFFFNYERLFGGTCSKRSWGICAEVGLCVCLLQDGLCCTLEIRRL